MNNLEKLISDLSNYWDISPDEVVDRLNFMNEQEINKIVDKMTKKFKNGGPLPKAKFENGGIMKCLKGGKTYSECMKCGGKAVRKAALGTQIGGKISNVARSTMFDDAAEFMPDADRKFVRQAYRTAKRAGRDLGLTGRGMRNWAKNQVSDRFREYADNSPTLPVLDDITIEDPTIEFNDSFTPLEKNPLNLKKVDHFGGSFNSAFASARKQGFDKFYWTDPTGKNSGWKTTELGKSTQNSSDTKGADVDYEKINEFSSGYNPNGGSVPSPLYNILYNIGAKLRK